ncbi:hypothetical protein ACWEQ0_21290 [Nocardia thailandica]
MSVIVADTGAAAWTEDNVLIVDSPLADLAPGHRVDDFDLLTALHTGERSRVFLARQRSMQRVVALRFVLGEADPQPMARLDHPHVVRTFDHRRVRFADGAGRMVWLEYVPGGNAAALVAGTGPDSGDRLLRTVDRSMDAKGEIRSADSRVRTEIAALTWPETVAWLGARLATALAYADRQGLHHGSIRSTDVLFTADGTPKLGGWAGSAASAADDVRDLAILLWHMLTGRETVASQHVPQGCPEALRRTLLRCLAPSPEERPDAAVLAEQLRLCLDSRARELVAPPPQLWRYRLVPWRVPLIVLAVVVPNAAASLYNIFYATPISQLRVSAHTQYVLDLLSAGSNVLWFSVGALVLCIMFRHIITVPGGIRAGKLYAPAVLNTARAKCLQVGDHTVTLVFVLWAINIAILPIGSMITGEPASEGSLVRITVLHLLCAAIALVYPYLLVNFFLIRSIYPLFLAEGTVAADERARLRGLRHRCMASLLVAASIPLLTVAAATLLPAEQLTRIIGAVRVLALGSVVLFAGAYLVFRALERDLRALERVGSGQE